MKKLGFYIDKCFSLSELHRLIQLIKLKKKVGAGMPPPPNESPSSAPLNARTANSADSTTPTAKPAIRERTRLRSPPPPPRSNSGSPAVMSKPLLPLQPAVFDAVRTLPAESAFISPTDRQLPTYSPRRRSSNQQSNSKPKWWSSLAATLLCIGNGQRRRRRQQRKGAAWIFQNQLNTGGSGLCASPLMALKSHHETGSSAAAAERPAAARSCIVYSPHQIEPFSSAAEPTTMPASVVRTTAPSDDDQRILTMANAMQTPMIAATTISAPVRRWASPSDVRKTTRVSHNDSDADAALKLRRANEPLRLLHSAKERRRCLFSGACMESVTQASASACYTSCFTTEIPYIDATPDGDVEPLADMVARALPTCRNDVWRPALHQPAAASSQCFCDRPHWPVPPNAVRL